MRRFVILFAVLMTTLSFVSPAFADEDPLRLAIVNASTKGGSKTYDLLEKFLNASDDIEVKNSDKVWDEADEVGLDKKDFRSSKKRKRSAKEFRSVMKSLDAEGILILDVFSKGRKMQLVVIGPSGEEIADVRKNIKRGRIKKDQAKEVLKEAFGELVPAVRDFRDNGGWDAYEEPEPEEEEEEDDEEEEVFAEEEEDGSLKDKAVANKSAASGLQPGMTLRFGALVGSRSFSMTSEEGFQLDHKSPWVGIAGRLDYIVATFGGDSAFGISAFGGYAPFTTIFDGDQEFASDYGRIGGELVYIKAFSENVALDVFGGAEARSITIDQNAFYTGNRYLAARIGGYVSYAAGALSIGAGAAVLPTFSNNNSNGAFGDPAGLSIGFEGNAGLGFNISEDIEAGIGYNFTTVGADFEEPVVIDQQLSASDSIHSGMVTIGYRLF